MGPLHGFCVIELAGIGPAPFCGMMLSDMGAEVIRIDRVSGGTLRPKDILARNRRSIAIDLKNPAGVETLLRLVESADALIEGFRPGVTERLGIGPDDCRKRNAKLVYGRITGWGQEGPLASAAGHDINYIALTGALHAIGRAGEGPVPPLNLVGDFGGGGMMLAFGVVCALLEAQKSGKGEVIDAAMVDGAAALMAFIYSQNAAGSHSTERGTNMLDSGAHYYDAYETSDGEHVCVGPVEGQFYQLLLDKLELDPERYGDQNDKSRWPEFKRDFAEIFKTRTRDEWCQILEGTDVCFAPVLSILEAPEHPHARARNSFVNIDGVTHQAATPRFSRSTVAIRHGAPEPGQDSIAILEDHGFSAVEIAALRSAAVIPAD